MIIDITKCKQISKNKQLYLLKTDVLEVLGWENKKLIQLENLVIEKNENINILMDSISILRRSEESYSKYSAMYEKETARIENALFNMDEYLNKIKERLDTIESKINY
jgi:hypothetical protein